MTEPASLEHSLRQFVAHAMHNAWVALGPCHALGPRHAGWRSFGNPSKATAHVLSHAEPCPGLVLDLLLEVIPPSCWQPSMTTSYNLVLTAYARRPGPGDLYRRVLSIEPPFFGKDEQQLNEMLADMHAAVMLEATATWLGGWYS